MKVKSLKLPLISDKDKAGIIKSFYEKNEDKEVTTELLFKTIEKLDFNHERSKCKIVNYLLEKIKSKVHIDVIFEILNKVNFTDEIYKYKIIKIFFNNYKEPISLEVLFKILKEAQFKSDYYKYHFIKLFLLKSNGIASFDLFQKIITSFNINKLKDHPGLFIDILPWIEFPDSIRVKKISEMASMLYPNDKLSQIKPFEEIIHKWIIRPDFINKLNHINSDNLFLTFLSTINTRDTQLMK